MKKTILVSLFILGVMVATPSAVFAKAAPVDKTTTSSWAGPYVGVHLGETWASMVDNTNVDPNTNETISTDVNSLIGGGQIGYNWQHEQVVFGVEGDVSKFNLSSQTPLLYHDEDWMMSLRGRLGYSFGQFLPYATLGVAFTDTLMKVPGLDSSSRLVEGVATGGGVDYKFAKHWIARVEYLYTTVPRLTSNFGAGQVSENSFNNTLRLGINYAF